MEHRSHTLQRWLTVALAVAIMIGMGTTTAFAQAEDVSGLWQVAGNRTTGTLELVQDANGVLTGSIFGDALEGLYIPSLRRLVFVRLLADGTPFQVYEAHVSTDGQRLGGSLIVWNGQGGASPDGVDFNFSGVRAFF